MHRNDTVCIHFHNVAYTIVAKAVCFIVIKIYKTLLLYTEISVRSV